jgi:ribosomal protein S27AE
VTALLIGTALAVASLCYVLYPLLRSDVVITRPSIPPRSPVGADASAVEALRELEFDRQTGKISDSDYTTLKARYTTQAVAVMRAGETNDKACPNCGPRPEWELDAQFCSNCGARLLS